MAKHRSSRSDTDDDTVGSTTNGTTKLGANGLMPIREIAIVNSSNFDTKKVKLGEEVESGGITRVGVQYKFEEGERALCLTCPKEFSAFFRCNGVEEETYAKKGGQRTGTGKNVMKFYLDLDNEYHVRFVECLDAMCTILKKKVEKGLGKKVDMKVRGLYDVKNDDGEVTSRALSARLIESNKGVTYTTAYNDEEQVDVKSVGRCFARPGLAFSYTVPDDNVYRINVSVTQVYYKARSVFPLRDVE